MTFNFEKSPRVLPSRIKYPCAHNNKITESRRIELQVHHSTPLLTSSLLLFFSLFLFLPPSPFFFSLINALIKRGIPARVSLLVGFPEMAASLNNMDKDIRFQWYRCSILRQPLLRKGGVDVVSCGRENVTYTMPGHGSFVVFLLFLVRGNGSLSPVTWRSNGVRRDLWPGVSSRVESPRGGGILHRVTVVEFHRSANEAIKWHDFHIDRDLSSNSLRKMSEYTCLQGE